MIRTKKPIVFEESFPHMSMSVIVNHLQGDEYTYVAQDITQKQMLEDRLREVAYFIAIFH